MVIYLGADHRGFTLKETLKSYLKEQGYEVVDMGAEAHDPNDDYADFAAAAAKKVSVDPERSRGVLICGSGAGMAITADKFRHVRAVLGSSGDQVYNARHDDNVNVLSIASDFTNETDAKKLVDVFMKTPFGKEERYNRRLDKINQIEDFWHVG